MSSIRSLVLTLIGYVAISSAGYAQQPPDVVVSDVGGNTAMGTDALLHLSSPVRGATENTAAGYEALNANTLGHQNSAFGAGSLNFNTTGLVNTAVGFTALFSNTTGNENTAVGGNALYANALGYENTAVGNNALAENTDGNGNAAFGFAAMSHGSNGSNNTALGANSLLSGTTGSDNTATGFQALYSDTTGSFNVAIGYNSGHLITTGSNNIEIANTAVAGDNGKIRIGTQGTQNATFIAGIAGTHVTGSAVYITAAGQLGVLASSERYKTRVASMGPNTQRLMQLRPVSFRLKGDPKGDVQYGLIAEEVAKVYPELVIRDEAGTIEGVRYEELAPLLLNEMQRQQGRFAEQARELREVRQQLAEVSDLARRAEDALQRLEGTR